MPTEWRGKKLKSFVVPQGVDGRGHYIAAGKVRDEWWVKSDDQVEAVTVENQVYINQDAYVAVFA